MYHNQIIFSAECHGLHNHFLFNFYIIGSLTEILHIVSELEVSRNKEYLRWDLVFKVCGNRRFLEFSHVKIDTPPVKSKGVEFEGLYCALSVSQAGTG